MIDILLTVVITAIVTAIIVRNFGRVYAKMLVAEAYVLGANDLFYSTPKSSPDEIVEAVEQTLRQKIEKGGK